jgi:hypothetical protein
VIHRGFIDTRYGVGGVGLFPGQLSFPFPSCFHRSSPLSHPSFLLSLSTERPRRGVLGRQWLEDVAEGQERSQDAEGHSPWFRLHLDPAVFRFGFEFPLRFAPSEMNL